MNYLQYVDSDSKNVELLRKSRTFNELTSILSTIKVSISQIRSRIFKKLAAASKTEIIVGSKSNSNLNSLKSTYEDLHALRVFGLEIECAKAVAFNIPQEGKKAKFDVLSTSLYASCIETTNAVYKLLDALGSSSEPKDLVEYSNTIKKLLASSLTYSKLQSFVLPSSGNNTSYTRYLVLHNVKASTGFIIPNVIVAINATNNFHDDYFYTVSFPAEVGFEHPNTYTFNTKKDVTSLVAEKLAKILGYKTELMPKIKKDPIRKTPNVYSAKTTKDKLLVELDSGVTASEINNTLTSLLPVIHALTGVSNIKTDILHRVSTSDSGTKIIEFQLKGRTLHDSKPLSNLKKMLPISKSEIESILSILGK